MALLTARTVFHARAEDVLENGMPFLDSPCFGAMRFRAEAAARVLQKQLGEPFCRFGQPFSGSQGYGGSLYPLCSRQKHECIAILDDISLIFGKRRQSAMPDTGQQGFQCRSGQGFEAWAFFLKKGGCKAFVMAAAFDDGLAYRGPQKCVLATSQFIWLRPMDRPLWYASINAAAAWTKGLCPHGRIFRLRNMQQNSCRAPHNDAAVESLKNSLSQGLAPKSGIMTPLPEHNNSKENSNRLYSPQPRRKPEL